MTAPMLPELFVPLPYTFTEEPPSDAAHEIRLSEATNDALPYVRDTWLVSYHRSQAHAHRKFRTWKREVAPVIDRVLGMATTKILVATSPEVQVPPPRVQAGRSPAPPRYGGPATIGWIVYTPGRSVSTVHYVYVRHKVGGIEWRRRGIMTALVDAAELGRRVAYTFRGEAKTGEYWTGPPGAGVLVKAKALPEPMDEVVVRWLKGRGVTAVYEPVREWLA